jgi:hypothetical protein
MKSFLVTLIILGLLFLAYDGFLAPPAQRLVFPRPAESPQEPTAESAPAASSATTTPSKSKPAAQNPASTAPATTAPTSASSDTPAKTAAPVTAKDGFQPPRFETLESLTNGWREIPKGAFGRIVKITKPVVFQMSVGKSSMAAGASVVAVGQENGWLIISPTADSPARAQIAVDDCDLKAQLSAAYESWKIARTDMLKRQFEKKKLREKNDPANVALNSGLIDASGKPVRSADGTYPLLMAKIHRGEVTEITPTNINRWDEAVQETVKGVPTWTIGVTFTTKTMFGNQTVDTVAHVQGGKVTSWVIKGSGEPVL